MRKTIVTKAVSVATAAALTLGAFPAVADAQSKSETSSKTVGRSTGNAVDADGSSLEGSSNKEAVKKPFQPYEMMSSGNIEQSSQGLTQAIINYAIIAAGVTIIGQIIQLVMANLPR